MILSKGVSLRTQAFYGTGISQTTDFLRGTLFVVQPTSVLIRERARRMRRGATLSERVLWNWLRTHPAGPFKFRRQHPIGRYILDFYCHELRLAIEVDGNQHNNEWVAEYDLIRESELRAHGIDVLRVSNKALAVEREAVLQSIRKAIECAAKRRGLA